MKMRLARRLRFAVLLTFFAAGLVVSQCALADQVDQQKADQEKSEQKASPSAENSNQQAEPENPNAEFGRELSTASQAAEKQDAAEAMKLRAVHSPIIEWFARVTTASPDRAYAIALVVNFGILFLFFWMLLRSKLPQAFRERTTLIQKGIKEAQAASADAARRLSDIEARLAKLDGEVTEIRATAEKEAAAEEVRIKQAAEDDGRKIVEAAESEISAIARNARRELKSFAASLAVDLAAKQIHVDDATDKALVGEFVSELGKDGK